MAEKQTALITAGGSGIGLQMAHQFLANGYEVAITDIDEAALNKAQKALPSAICLQADVANEASMRAVEHELDNRWARLDVVMANAGIAGPTSYIEDVTLKDWKHCIAVNLDGAFLACRYAASRMKQQGSGVITLTSSTAGLFGYPCRSPYAAAKWGIIGLMKTLAMELGPSAVRVNAICPGAVNGDRMDRVIANEARTRGLSEESLRAGYAKCVSLRQFVNAEDIADMAVFLASDKAKTVSGMAMAVDGHTEQVTL